MKPNYRILILIVLYGLIGAYYCQGNLPGKIITTIKNAEDGVGYLHASAGGYAKTINDENEATRFVVTQALNGNMAAVSFLLESDSNVYLRHQSYFLKAHTNDGTRLFSDDACFKVVPSLSGGDGEVSLESCNYGNHYIKYNGDSVKIVLLQEEPSTDDLRLMSWHFSDIEVIGNRSASNDDAQSRATCPEGYAVSYCEVQSGEVHTKHDGAFVDPDNGGVCVAVNGASGNGAIARAVCSQTGQEPDPCNGPNLPKYMNIHSRGATSGIECPAGYEQIVCNARSPWLGQLRGKEVSTKGVIPNDKACAVSGCTVEYWCEVTAVCKLFDLKAVYAAAVCPSCDGYHCGEGEVCDEDAQQPACVQRIMPGMLPVCDNNDSCGDGKCIPDGHVSYTCECVAGFEFNNVTVSCVEIQTGCDNNDSCGDGECIVVGNDGYTCECVAGFELNNVTVSCIPVRTIDCGTLTIGLHYIGYTLGDRVLEITEAKSFRDVPDFNSKMSRYKIDGYGTWAFYYSSDLTGEPLFIKSGPVDWTDVESKFNDKVSSVKPVGNCWSLTPIKGDRLLVPIAEMETTRFGIKTKEVISDKDVIDIEFLEQGTLKRVLSVRIGNDGLHLELDAGLEWEPTPSGIACRESLGDDGGVIRDHYAEGVLSSGIWDFLKQENQFTVSYNGSVFYEFDFDETCLEVFSRIGAVKFKEDQSNGASEFYNGNLGGDCPLGYSVTDYRACQECPRGSYSDSSPALTCTRCPKEGYSAPRSTSSHDCTDTQYFKDMEAKKTEEIETTNYSPFWKLDPDIEIYLAIERPQKEDIGLNCYVIVYVESVQLDIDLGTFRNFINKKKYEIHGYISYRLGDYDSSDVLDLQDVYNIKITSGKKRISVEVNGSDDKRELIRNFALETNSTNIAVGVTNKECFNFVESRSYIKRIDEVVATAPPIEPEVELEVKPTDDPAVEKLSVHFCKQSYFRHCKTVDITLSETWSNMRISSIRILNIPKDRAVIVTSNLHVSYTVYSHLVDNNLADGISQIGFHLEGEGGSSIIAVEYVIYDEPTEPPGSKTDSVVTKKPPKKKIKEIDPTKEPPTEYDPPDIFVKIKELYNDTIEFEEEKEDNKTVGLYKPDFQGGVLPISACHEKAINYTEDRNKTNLLGFLTYNGYTDVGITISNKKKDTELDSVQRRENVDEDAMIETIKAFQKFNGFPETGAITSKELEILQTPRCGNHDTSYKDNSESFHCIEGTVLESDLKREECDLDRDIILDVCAHYPTDFISSTEQIDEFVWNQGYYFEADIDFRKTGKPVSHIGIAFNYNKETREAEYLFVQSELTRNYKRLCFSYGTYKQGKRKEIANVRKCLKFDKEQEVLFQFKIRLTVNPVGKGPTYVSVNGKREFKLKPRFSTRSSVFLFTLGGRNYIKHKVAVFTSRICRRNTHFETTRIRKKRGVTQFKWYPNGAAITYSFVNYSSSLGEQLTRQEIIKAIDVYSSHGLQFKEEYPQLAESADIVFMFMENTKHADGMRFLGAGMEKAHAFVPVHGEIHFNGFEKYSVVKNEEDPTRTTSLFYVALHEMGHALGLSHSEEKDAIMTPLYDSNVAYDKLDLDYDDLGWLQVHYSDEGVTYDLAVGASSGSKEFSSVEGSAKGSGYLARMPFPTNCLDRIEAAFYYYDRGGIKKNDKVYMMSHGYLWVYNATSFAMYKGYPKRAAEVFAGAYGEIDAAFDTGIFVYIIVQERVYIYQPYKYDNTVFVQPQDIPSPQTLNALFGISETKIRSAFNTYKASICLKNRLCVKTALIIDTEKYYEVSFSKRSKKDVVMKTLSLNAAEIIGMTYGKYQFEAAFELRSNEVIQFNNRRDFRRRDLFPGTLPADFTDKVVDVPERFQIDGWCTG